MSVFGFSKKRRLLVKKEFDFVFQKANRLFQNEFLILYRKNHYEHARIGFVISKKSVSKAVERNRCRRVVRESFRNIELPNVDIIFLSRKGLAHLSNQQIKNKLAHSWQKLSNAQNK